MRNGFAFGNGNGFRFAEPNLSIHARPVEVEGTQWTGAAVGKGRPKQFTLCSDSSLNLHESWDCLN